MDRDAWTLVGSFLFFVFFGTVLLATRSETRHLFGRRPSYIEDKCRKTCYNEGFPNFRTIQEYNKPWECYCSNRDKSVHMFTMEVE